MGQLGTSQLGTSMSSNPASGPASGENASGATRAHYLVEGMTCGHCVSSVTESVSAIDGVESVSVDLNAGGASRIMVVSTRPIAEESISRALGEAGYALVVGR